VWCVGVCIRADDVLDLALLQIVTGAPPSHAYPTVGAAVAKGLAGTRVLCVGNPSAFHPTGEDSEFSPPIFHTSTGIIAGKTSGARKTAIGLGSLRHTCWTYWGHSGAPLLAADGAIMGIHNTWDDEKGTRHGVGVEEIRAFIGASLLSTLASSSEGGRVTAETNERRVRKRRC
jgi:hypothetical protein